MNDLRRAIAVPLTALLALAGLTACTGSDAPSPQKQAATRFADALGAHDAAKAAAATDDPTAAGTAIAADLDALGRTTRGTLRVGKVTGKGSTTAAAFSADWTIGTQHWKYDGSVALVQRGKSWSVHWQPADLHPKLTAGTTLALRRTQPARAALLDSSGAPLFVKTPVVRVGVEKKLVTNLTSLATTLAAIPQLASTRAEIVAAVKAAAPTDFVPIITLRRPVYEQIRARVYNLPGTVFQSDTEPLGPSAGFGQPLLGRVGDPTKEIIDRSNGRVAAGDVTGVGGLQQALDATLAGTAGVSVVAQPEAGDTPATVLAVLSVPRAGTPVHLTVNRAVQSAAESALASVSKPAALVAVQRSTGRILADADTPAVTYDYGLAGAFPPGSTFKIATWSAVFSTQPSATPATTVACPGTTTVDGRRFVNENKFSHPPISITAAFGYSCNTSAIAKALTLPSTALADTARTLGLGAKWALPVQAFSGSLPAPASQTERAADAIGQGKVLASPLLMALMAGAVTSGNVITPSITTSAKPTVSTLPAALVAKMTTLMRAPVSMPDGTASALASVGGVLGKTGTAEYGTATPPRTHSWFAGVKGDVAFAVFVYDGATTGVDAVPIAERFLKKTG